MKFKTILPFITAMLSLSFTNKKNDGKFYEATYVPVNGTQQYVLISARDTTKPILLFLHGGPGASETSMLRKHNAALEDDFTVVYWDQRGAGNSFDKQAAESDMTVQNMVADVHTLVAYLKQRFHQEKVILIGHSTGTRWGLYAVKERPQDYLMYVGVGQEVATIKGEMASYSYALETAEAKKKKKALKQLQDMGPPNGGHYLTMYKGGYDAFSKQKQLLLHLDGNVYKKSVYFQWMFSLCTAREYNMADAFGFISRYDIASKAIMKDAAYNNIDFFTEIPSVAVPAFFISGTYDYVLPWTVVEEYCHALQAPQKAFIKFEQSGHNPAFEEPEKFNQEILRLYNLTQ